MPPPYHPYKYYSCKRHYYISVMIKMPRKKDNINTQSWQEVNKREMAGPVLWVADTYVMICHDSLLCIKTCCDRVLDVELLALRQNAWCWAASFEQHARCWASCFGQSALCWSARFGQSAWYWAASFGQSAWCWATSFERELLQQLSISSSYISSKSPYNVHVMVPPEWFKLGV